MDDLREKMVELIGSTEYGTGSLVGNNFQKGFLEKIADHLIANGVTVQEWISVKDRLPVFTEEEIERYRFLGDSFFPEFNVMILGATQPTTLYYDGEKWYDEEAHCYYVTHWQPLPQPPKEV